MISVTLNLQIENDSPMSNILLCVWPGPSHLIGKSSTAYSFHDAELFRQIFKRRELNFHRLVLAQWLVLVVTIVNIFKHILTGK